MDENYLASRYKSWNFFSIFQLGFKFQKWFPYYLKNLAIFNLTNLSYYLVFQGMGAMVQIQVQAAIPQIQTIIHQATVSPIQSMSKWCGDRPPGGVAANESRPQPFMAYFLLLCCTLFSDNYYFSVYISTVTTIFSSQTKIRYLQSPLL